MWKWLIAVVALAGAIFGIVQARRSVTPEAVPPLANSPLLNPDKRSIAGSGLVEPSSENIVIGVSDPGMVMKVFVKQEQKVKAGEKLFEIDSRILQGQTIEARAAVKSAQADLAKVIAYRRKEEEPQLRAKLLQAQALTGDARVGVLQAQALAGEAEGGVAEAETNIASENILVKDFQDQLDRNEKASTGNAVPEEQMVRTRFKLDEERIKLETARAQAKTAQAKLATARAGVDDAREKVKTAEAGVASAQADLDLFLAGAWAPDVDKAKAAVTSTEAAVARLEGEIERRTVRAPLDATVLRVNLRLGEYALADSQSADSAAMVLGVVPPLHVRADIDEYDAQRFKPQYKAWATPKGGGFKDRIPLELVRVDPFVIPKRALTNSQRELVDTRVLEIIYRIPDAHVNLYVGQQVDVTIEEDEAGK